ncbi:MAG TPA: hypothetical protein VEL03_18790 [Streptosporangiaceae bacterium]|nr:hypothetical protein [Streptosporangiaceae bacterium]
MRTATRHLMGAAIGLCAAAAVCVLLAFGEWRALGVQVWAQVQYPAGPRVAGPELIAPVGATAAALVAAAAILVGCLCGWRALSPAGPLAAGVALFGAGMFAAADFVQAARVLRRGELTDGWQSLVTDHVLLVVGGVLVIAALMPGRWRAVGPALPRTRSSPAMRAVAVLAGIVAIPVAWYLVQLSNQGFYAYPNPTWLGFRPTADLENATVAGVVVVLGLLAASRPVPRITGVIAGTPMLAMGLAGLLAPRLASEAIRSLGFSPSWRYAILQALASCLTLLYGGILVVSGLAPESWPSAGLLAALAGSAQAGSAETAVPS